MDNSNNERKKHVLAMIDRKKPSVAAGDDKFLKKEAGGKDKARGDYTRVTTFSYDEVDPS
ncbi:hypothetical protein [Desulfallas thermosapovorans]|uniref:Uncharacterized protein n=1 Tax=Desulfallas thermosapovorans DSM 6562 TaxID=1121431 RepID=A0A5S4ZRE9_9FIRM|nr:hypothetical protein [Desulfallas thermosapovorans]TYO95383.1 hypothetical protein LX24_01734 [Desulfallas thermosapovorans DSM 6562]